MTGVKNLPVIAEIPDLATNHRLKKDVEKTISYEHKLHLKGHFICYGNRNMFSSQITA